MEFEESKNINKQVTKDLNKQLTPEVLEEVNKFIIKPNKAQKALNTLKVIKTFKNDDKTSNNS